MRRKVNKKFLIGLIIVFLIIDFILIYPLFLTQNLVVHEMDVYVTDQNEDALNADSDKIHFGILSNSSYSAYRVFSVKNPYNFDVKVKLWAEGEMVERISYEYNDFILASNETKELKIVYNKANQEVGYYQGKTYVHIRKTYFMDYWFS